MKWLVQTLDFLGSQCPLSQAEMEQKKLDVILTKYKNLIPSIEITMIKTDTLSKCYSYRREVREVCELLKKVRDVKAENPQPSNLPLLINVQQSTLSHLDAQRPSIMSILQKGKELEKDMNAPSFIKEEVENLEQNWSETYRTTLEKLTHLKETHKIWTSYDNQKNEIILLLAKAEQQLRDIHPSEYNLRSLPAELKKRQEQAIHLRERIEEMLRRLTKLCSELSEQAPTLKQEIQDLEKRYKSTIENAQKNISNLEQYTVKINTFQNQLSKLEEWTTAQAPLLLSSVEQEDIPPQEKIAKTEKLQQEIIHHITLLNCLDSEAQEIEVHPEEAPKFHAKLSALRQKVENVNTNVETQRTIINQDLKNWEVCQANLLDAKPWLDRAEKKVKEGLKKPQTLEEAIQMKSDNDKFADECKIHSEKLQGILSLSHQLSSKTPTHDDIDSSLSKHTIIFDTVHQWDRKLNKLVANWSNLDSNLKDLEAWINKSRTEFIQQSINLNTPNIEKLEIFLSELKSFNNELSEQQAKLIGLTQSLDAVSHHISPEALNLNKTRLQEMKTEINKLSDGLRARMNACSDSILAKHESQAKIAQFTNWIYDFKNNISRLDEIVPDNIDATLINVHSLLQEHSEKQPAFNEIYEEVKEISLRTTGDDNEAIASEYSTISQNYQEIHDNLLGKKNALEKWSELINWYNDSLNQLQYLTYQTENKNASEDDLNKAMPELHLVSSKLAVWKENIPSFENMMNVTIISKQTGLPLTAENLIREVEMKTTHLQSTIQKRIENLNILKNHWQSFQNIQDNIQQNLNELKIQTSNIYSMIETPSDIVTALDHLNNLSDQSENLKLKEELRKEGLHLTKEDIQNVSVIQGAISQIESHWNKTIEDIRNLKLEISNALAGWKDFQEAKERVAKDISDLKEGIQNFETPNDLQQAKVNFEKATRLSEAFKRFKLTLDKLESKAQIVIKKCENLPALQSEIRNGIQEMNRSWSSIYESILNMVQKTESQVTIWKDIDNTKNDLLKWLSEQNIAFTTAIEKPNELEAAKMQLEKYREELPLYSRLKQSLSIKCEQLRKLSNEDISPLQVLQQVINDQFENVEMNAKKLSELTSNFGTAKKNIQDKLKLINSQMSSLREQIIKCEDLGGDNRQVVERVLKIQMHKNELKNCEGAIEELEQDLKQIKIMYPNLIEGVFPKEQQLIKKRYDDLMNHSNKIENTLLGFLKKVHSEKFGVLQRLISTYKEKIEWCTPDSLADKYNLEVKLKSLIPIEKALDECDSKASELEGSLGLLTEVEHPEVIKLLQAEKEHLSLELNTLKGNYQDTKEMLENTVELHQKYGTIVEEISSWLKTKENDIKIMSSTPTDVYDLENKLEEMMKLNNEITNFEENIDALKPISSQLSNGNSEDRITQHVEQLSSRYFALKNFMINYIKKIQELKQYKMRYQKSVEDVKNWLSKAEIKVKAFEKISAKPDQATLRELKGFSVEKEEGHKLLHMAVETGEAMYPGITPDNRETIRNELRILRENAERLIEEVNILYKNVETMLTQKHSFEDSLQQITVWMNEINSKLSEEYVLDKTLPEKRETLYNLRATEHDIDLHKTILKKLKDSISELNDTEAQQALTENVLKCDQLLTKVNEFRLTAEDCVKQHEIFDTDIEKCRNWLDALTSEAVILVDDSSSYSAESKLSMVQDLLSQREQGDQTVANCRTQLKIVLEQTAEDGHPPLKHLFDEQKKSWDSFLQFCFSAQQKLDEISTQYFKLDNMIKDLEEWLKIKENQVRDQSLKSTEETKTAHLTKLEMLNNEILGKEEDLKNISKEYGNIDSNFKIPTILSRYETLKNSSREVIRKYKNFVDEHKHFNEAYNHLIHWLTEKAEDLQDLSHIVGDVGVIQNRHKDIELLMDERNKKSSQFDSILERGEKLYSHTSPDGREIIRQQLKNLRTIWDSFADDLQNSSHKLDQCLVQFSDFTMTQEQLTKWLKDVETAMQQHTELKSTLQEKRAQFQNHKIMHQEIMSHQQLVEAVCDKAQKLVDQTQDKSLNMYLQSIKQLFLNIENKSEELLNNLNSCVNKHIDFNDGVASFKEWLREMREKLQDNYETSGEKSDLQKRVSVLDATKTRHKKEGEDLLNKIREKLISTARSTAPEGVKILNAELEELSVSFLDYLTEIGEYMKEYRKNA